MNSSFILKNAQALTSLGCVPTTQPRQKNHELIFLTSLMEHVQSFELFVNQMHMVIQFHPYYYPNNLIQARLISTLLLKMTLTWFAPLLECQYSFLNDIKTYIHC